jgi:hypothetical protein
MTRLKPWTVIAVGLTVAFATVVLIYAAVAQPPAKAPVPVEARDAEDAKVPPLPGDRLRQARERADVMRKVWGDSALLSSRGPSAASMLVEGEHVYVLYGPYLLQLSVDGLKLEAKVDLREALGLEMDREVRARVKEAREARKTRAAEPEAEEEAVEQ